MKIPPVRLRDPERKCRSVRSKTRRCASHFAWGALFLSGCLLARSAALAADGTWKLNANGTWSTTANWNGTPGVIADGVGATADFTTLNITTATRTVTIDSARTLGILKLGDTDGSNHYVIAAGAGVALTFNNNGSNAQLNMASTSQGEIISAPLLLQSSLDINNASASGQSITGNITGNAVGTMTITNASSGSGGIALGNAATVIADGAGGQVVAVNQNSATSTMTMISTGNTYSGGTTLTKGILVATSATNAQVLGSGTITFAGGQLDLRYNPANNVAVQTGTTSTLNLPNAGRTLGTAGTGTFTGGGTLNVTYGAAGLTLSLSNSMTSFSGTINLGASVNSGVLLLVGNSGGNTGSSLATFDLGGGSSTLRVSDAAAGKTVNLGALKGGGSTMVEGSSNNSTAIDTIVIGGSGQSTTFDGTIRNGQGAPSAHTVAVTKTGVGTLTLTGASTYTDVTTVQNGTLVVNGALSGSSATAVENGTLAGGGTITNGVTVGDNAGASGTAMLAPGTDGTIGTLKTGTLSLNSTDAAFKFDLQTSGSLLNDQVQVTGSLTLGAGIAQLAGTDLLSATLAGNTVITLFTTTAGITGTFAGLVEHGTYVLGNNSYQISYGVDVANAVTLTVLVPEPGSRAMMLGGLALLVGFPRRARRWPAS